MARTKVRWARLVGLALIAALAVALFATTAGAGSSRVRIAPLRTHVVRRGETVWSIAKTIVGEQDPRPIVDEIIDVNRIEDAAIFPGEVLRVPPAAASE